MTRKWWSLEEELLELERTDPEIGAAAESYARTVAEILDTDRVPKRTFRKSPPPEAT